MQPAGAEYRECREIDESSPSSTSLHPDKMFHQERGVWKRRGHQRLHRQQHTKPVQCSIQFLELDRHRSAQTCRHNCSFTKNGHYFVSTRSRKCCIAKREHRGNNIWFDIDTNQQTVYQRCYDQDCRQAFQVAVPPEQWSLWNRTWHQLIHAPRNENTLFNMSQ